LKEKLNIASFVTWIRAWQISNASGDHSCGRPEARWCPSRSIFTQLLAS